MSDSLNPVFQMNNIEVDQQTEGLLAHFEIRKKLGFVYRQYFFHCFQLNNHCVFNKTINAITDVNPLPIIYDR